MVQQPAGTVRRVPPAGAGRPALAYRDAGPRSRAALVLLHSLGTDGRLWAPQLTSLAGEYRLIIPDTRGHGESGWDGPIGIGTWADDIARVLDHADVPAAWLAGVSMGGVQAIAFAAEHPGRVTGLVIADSFAELEPDTAAAKTSALAGQAQRLGMAGLADAYVAGTITGDPASPGAAAVRDAIASTPEEGYVASVRTCFGARLGHCLAGIAAPALVLWGERDAKTPLHCSEHIAAGIRGARLEVIPDAGHLSNIENPAAFTAATSRFIAAAAAAPAGSATGNAAGSATGGEPPGAGTWLTRR
jgi:3-oxoadipate enol-lactonase